MLAAHMQSESGDIISGSVDFTANVFEDVIVLTLSLARMVAKYATNLGTYNTAVLHLSDYCVP